MRRFKKLFVALLVVATVLGTVTTFASAAGTSLADIEGTKYEAAVNALVGVGVLTGFPDGTYKANATLTRAEAAAIMVRALGFEDTAKLSKGATPFSDVPATDWASGYINVAYAQNIINGIGNNQFAPLREVTYAELATMLVRAAGLAKEAVGAWPTNFITVATKYGLTADTNFSANAPATRGDTALMTNVTVFETKNPDTGKTLAQSVFNVGPKAATVTVTGSATAVAIGGQVTFTAKAVDADGNEIADVTPVWSVDKNGVIDQNGVFGASASGVATVTAKIGDVTGTATVNVYGTATAIKLSTPGVIVANGESTGTLTATIVDAAGNTVGNYSGNVAFSSTGGGVDLSSNSVAVANGVASVTLTSHAAGNTATTYVNASCNGLTGAFVAVTPAAQTLTSFVISASPATLAADGRSSTTISVAASDQEGQDMAFPADVTGTLTVSDTNIASFGGNATASVNSGATTANLTAKANIGSATVSGAFKKSGTALTLPVTNATVNTLVVGAPYKLAIDTIADATANTTGATGTTQKVVARVLDVNGNQVTGADLVGGGVTLTISATGADGGAPVVAGPTYSAGTATWTYTDTTAESVSYTVKGTYNTTPAITLASATASGNFTAGPITQVTLTGSPLSGTDVLLNATGATGTLTASLADSEGNPVSAGSYSITFKKDSNAGATPSFADTTVTSVNGSASVSISSTTNNGVTDVYKAYVTVNGVQYASFGRNVTTKIMGPANKLSVANVGAQTAGTAFTVTAYVQDFAGTTVTTDSGRAVTLTVYDSSDDAVGTYTATSSLGSAKFSVTLNTADTGYYFAATSTGLTDSADSLAFNVASATGTTISVTPDLTTIGADGSVSAVTFALADAYGNEVNAPVGGIALTIGNTNPAAGTIAGTATIAAGSPSVPVNFTATSYPGVATISASASGYTGGSATINTITVGSAAKLGITAIADATAGGNQSIYVQVLDAAGNRVTNAGTHPTLKLDITKSDGTTTWGVAGGTYDRGQVKFTFTDTKAETVTYYAYSTDTPSLVAYTATGNFTAASATKVVLSVLPNYVVANGSSVATLTAKVADTNGNTVPSATGTMDFSIVTGNDFGTLLSTSAPIVNGVATVQLQSKTGAGTINLKAAVDGSTTITPATNVYYTTFAGNPSNVVVTAVYGTNKWTLTAVVRDQYGNPIDGATAAPNPNLAQKVTFSVVSGNGNLSATNPALSAIGQASVDYGSNTLGRVGDQVKVTVDGFTSVTYTVTMP